MRTASLFGSASPSSGATTASSRTRPNSTAPIKKERCRSSRRAMGGNLYFGGAGMTAVFMEYLRLRLRYWLRHHKCYAQM